MESIAEVVRQGLCTGCGTCAGVCPNGAIAMQISSGLMLPRIQEEKCNQCGICVQCCPGHRVDFEELNATVFGRQPKDVLLGNYLGCYVGHSNDSEIRSRSSSGGITTELLILGLEKGIFDGALVVRMKEQRPLEPEPFIARTKEEIVSASKSKYCPVPMNEALQQLLKEDGRFAVVGLPCHIHGIRKAESVFRKLQKKIVLHLGLVCSRTANFSGTEFLLEKMGVEKEHVVGLSYRDRGWPGSMTMQLVDGSTRTLPCRGWSAYWPIFSAFFFTPVRCIMCPDHTSELADVSLGDAWLPELAHETSGESIVVARTKAGDDFLTLARREGAVSLTRVESAKVRQAQAEPLKFKKGDLRGRLAVLESMGSAIPAFTGSTPNSSHVFASFLRTFYAYFNIQVSSKASLVSILARVPFPLFRLYYGIRKYLSLI